MTASPNRLTARLARVLSADSSETNAPMSITAIVPAAASGFLSLAGIRSWTRTAVCFHTVLVGFMITETGT